MFSAKRITLISVAALAALSWTDSVNAAESLVSSPVPGGVAIPSAVSLSSGASAPVSEFAIVRRNPFGSKPMTSDALASRRGGEGVFNDNQLKGVVSNNSASNLTTGTNTISEGAFAGAVGLPTVIQNSGNNVLIQNATIVNVQLK